MSHGKKARNLQGPDAPQVAGVGMNTALAFEITQHEYTRRVTGTLRLAFSNERSPVKKLAEVAQCSLATAKNWYEQRHAPEGLHQLRLLAAVPEYQAEVRRLTNMRIDMDPRFDRALNDLLSLHIRRRQEAAERDD